MPPSAPALSKTLDFLPERYPRLTVVTMLMINLAAFWLLLHGTYSPQNYQAATAAYDTVSWTWFHVSWVAALALLLWLHRRPDECRQLARAGYVVTTASLIVLLKRWLGAPVQCLDPILFATACGWTTALWLRHGSLEGRGSERPSILRWHLQPVTLLTLGVCAATAGLFIYYMAQQLGCLRNLGLGYPDCGEMARLMYNTISNPRELFLRINPERLLFDDHFQPGIVPLVPLWLVWPDLKLLILLQVICALSPTVPLYWIGKRLFQDQAAALLLVVAWLVYPSTSQFIYSGGFGFHWGNVCPLLYFVALAFWIHGRPGWALPIALWAILIKEEACIPIGMFGLYVALFERRRLLGSVIAGAAFGSFLLITSVIIPAMSQQPFYMQRFFSDLGATKWEILLSPWTKPGFFWGRLLSPSTFYFGALLLAPVLFIPLKKPSILLVGSLVFLFDCLAEQMLNSICYWYQAALWPVVFWALAAALPGANPRRTRATLCGVVMASVLLSLFFGNTFWSKADWSPAMSPGRLPAVQRMARLIDPRGSLFATPRAAAHFIKQKYLYTNPSLPAQLDYLLLDLHDPLLTLGVARDFQRQVEARPDLRLVAAEDGLLLYARQGAPLDRHAVVARDRLPDDAIHQEAPLNTGVVIVGFSLTANAGESDDRSDLVRVSTFSMVPVLTNTDVAVQCTLAMEGETEDGGRYSSKLQFLGQSIWPISQWTTNKLYCDDFLVKMPKGASTNRFAIRFEAIPGPLIP